MKEKIRSSIPNKKITKWKGIIAQNCGQGNYYHIVNGLKKNRIDDHCDWLQISADQNFKHQVDVRQSSNYLAIRSLRYRQDYTKYLLHSGIPVTLIWAETKLRNTCCYVELVRQNFFFFLGKDRITICVINSFSFIKTGLRFTKYLIIQIHAKTFQLI